MVLWRVWAEALSLSQRHLDEVSFDFTGMAEAGIKHRPERPILQVNIPLRPSIACDGGRSAGPAKNLDALVEFDHPAKVNNNRYRGKCLAAKSWSEAVLAAVRRHVAISGSKVFTRHALIDAELDRIVAATGSAGATPHQTLSRELQQLRDAGVLAFVEPGTYRLAGSILVAKPTGATKGVFVTGPDSAYQDEVDRFYRFPKQYLPAASRIVGEWIVYLEPRRSGKRGYFAVAKVEKVTSDPTNPGMHLALLEPGSFLELGRSVPFNIDGSPAERGLLNSDGSLKGLKQSAIRPLSNADFNRIVELGLVEEDEVLPRESEEQAGLSLVQEEHAPFEGPIDREIMLVNRKVRDRQFRKTVLDAYDGRCALTGMRLINGGGRLETQAAHIMSVEAGGPDRVNNGLALSGTAHWMFDRGLIGVSDTGNILLSSKINDIQGVQKILYNDGKVRLPISAASRPHPHYLEWHRQKCFHG